MFFETLRFSRISVLKLCVPWLKSWRGGKVNTTLFFYTTHKQVLQIVPMLNQSYKIIMRTSLNHDCCTCVGPCMIYFFFWGGGGGWQRRHPWQSMDGWHERWPFCRLAVCQLHYDALERTVSLKTAISTLQVNMWLLHTFLRCSLIFSLN